MQFCGLQFTDPDFVERFEAFADDEVINTSGVELDDPTRLMAILAVLLGCKSAEAYRAVLEEALVLGALTPVQVKEIVYQAVPYVGMGSVYGFLAATNEVMEKLGVQLPLENQATTTMEDRLEKGAEAQVKIFGEGMKDFWRGGHINRWLAANCFGDYYTRATLDLKQREMITFCILAAMGGCEAQLSSHVAGNLHLRNDSSFLVRVVSQCLPYMGYPRSLNALTCIRQVAESV